MALDAVYKHGRFSKALLEKGLEFVLGKKIDSALFLWYLMLLLLKINPIAEK